jgi:hypothetical protein
VLGPDFGPDYFSSKLQIGFIFAVFNQRIPLVLNVKNLAGNFRLSEGLIKLFD